MEWIALKSLEDDDKGDEEPEEEEEIDTWILTARRPFAVKRAVAIYGVPVFPRYPSLSQISLPNLLLRCSTRSIKHPTATATAAAEPPS
ncbi:hypothetical protein ABZP36_033848 [Zizania latifolia]